MSENNTTSLVTPAIEAINNKFTLQEAPCGRFETLKISGIMKFFSKKYTVAGLGNVCTMTMNMGIMKMETVVISPYEKNVPLVSLDLINAFGKWKLIAETYDIGVAEDEKYSALREKLETAINECADVPNMERKEAWYDGLRGPCAYKVGKKCHREKLMGMMLKMLEEVLAEAKAQEPLSETAKETKRKAIEEYSNGLVEKGGVSTDVFKKQLGVDETKEFFANVFFGTK